MLPYAFSIDLVGLLSTLAAFFFLIRSSVWASWAYLLLGFSVVTEQCLWLQRLKLVYGL